MTPLLEVNPQLLLSGINPSLPVPLCPLWTDGVGVIFADASVQNFPGQEDMFQLSEPPVDMIQAFVNGSPRLYVGTSRRLLKYTLGAGVTELLLGDFGAWNLVAWGDWLIASDGVSPVLVSKDTAGAVALAGVNFTSARVIEKYANYIFAANTSNGETRVQWSTLDNPEVWIPDVNNTAGGYTIRDMDSGIMSTAALGSVQALYSGDSMFTMRYVTDRDVVFSILPAVQGLGAVSRRSVVSDGRFNWGLTQRSVFKTDGISKAFVDEPRVRKILRESTDWDAAEQIYGSLDETRHLVQWHLPQVAGGFKTLAYDYEGDSWTYPHAGVYCGLEDGTFNSLLLGRAAKIQRIRGSTPAASYIQTKPLDCGTRDKHKLFQELWLDIEADAGVEVHVSYCMDSVYDTPTAVEVYPAAERIPLNVETSTAVAIIVKISAPDGKSWRLAGMRIQGELGGNVS